MSLTASPYQGPTLPQIFKEMWTSIFHIYIHKVTFLSIQMDFSTVTL